MPNFSLRDKVDEAEGGFAGEVDESAHLQDDNKGRRFLHAIVTAGCIYFLLRFASQQFLFHDLFTSWGTHHASEEQFLPDKCLQESDWSLPRVQLPVDPMAPRLSAVDTFESFATLNIPIDSADRHLTTLVFISQHWPGTFRVITSPYQANDSITFNVSAKYQAPEFLSTNFVDVCAPSSRRYAKGFMIFSRAPQAVANLKHLGKFDTTLILPEPTKSNSEPLLFSELQSYAAHTDHFIADVGSKVRFKSVFLKSRKSIEVESLSADRIEISSLGGPIRGTFNTTTGLALTTANSPILVNVNINNTGTFQSQTPYFTATTSNSPIKATISLFSRIAHPSFSVSGRSTNSPVELTFKDAPLGSRLRATIDTTNSPGVINAHPTYEGTFTLRTTVMEPELNEDLNVVDPSGQGRQRKFQYTLINTGSISGKVYWGDDPTPPPPGLPRPYPQPGAEMILISTSNSPAVLNL